MVLEIRDLRPELFPTEECFVVTDTFKMYKFKLEEGELRNNVIERMYGPFTSVMENHSPVGSPRPMIRSEDASKQAMIDDLKRRIAIRQAVNDSAGKPLADEAKKILKRTQDTLQTQNNILQANPSNRDEASSQPMDSTVLSQSEVVDALITEVATSLTITPQENNVAEKTRDIKNAQDIASPAIARKEKVKTPIIIIDDTDEDMSIASDDDIFTMNQEDANDIIDLTQPKDGGAANNEGAENSRGNIDNNHVSSDEVMSNGSIARNEGTSNGPGDSGDSSRSSDMDMSGDERADSSSSESFYTATDNSDTEDQGSSSQYEVKKLKKELKAMQTKAAKLNAEKKVCEDESKKIQLKLLGMQVRLSMNKNRNELKKKNVQPERRPSLGEIRKSRSDDDTYQLHRTSRRRLGYTQHDNFNYGFAPPPPFYQQLPHQPMNPYIPSQPTYVPSHMLHQPPPPPPGLPPFTPPPPPPPPPTSTHPSLGFSPQPPFTPPTNRYPVQTNNKKSKKGKKMAEPTPETDTESDILPMEQQNQIKNTLKEFEEFITLRVFQDKTHYPITFNRPLSRPYRLVTVDDYTMPYNMIIINANKDNEVWKSPSTKFTLPAGLSTETEMDNSWFESPFFVMLRRKAMSQRSNPLIQRAIDDIIKSIPPFINLSVIKIGTPFFVSLEDTLEVARTKYHQHPENEFFASLKLELSFYVNGNTSQFMDDYKVCIAGLPLSVDVEWQRIRAEVTFSYQLPMIIELLEKIYEKHTTFHSQESANVSSMTAEVLIRLIRLNGLEEVLRLMTHNKIEVQTDRAEIFDMEDGPKIYLQEHDKYFIWMIILYYNVNKTMPDYVCDNWMNSLVKDGKPLFNTLIFMIDWSTSQLIERPLDTATLFSTTNIILSMLRYFGNKACTDVKRKPLMVGVLRTLSNFLSHIPSYKPPMALMVMRHIKSLDKQIPEIRELITDLEIETGTKGIDILAQLFETKVEKPQSRLFTYSYNIARSYYEKQPFTKYNLLIVSHILLNPLLTKHTKNVQRDTMKLLTEAQRSTIDDSQIIVTVDTIKQRFFSSLGLDYSAPNTPQSYNEQSKKLRKISFAWINLLLLTAISKFLYPETSVIRDKLDATMDTIFEKAMAEIDSEAGQMILFKYAKNLK
ncbi:hypothetical protein INT47_010675 [Mucor saturninus]|uniref:Uncharacterized protein n=1 Tax=Mucor saturninus TaxID=64648 RepID=A0A8H7V156_9FUNG|nr:hypothetical protein INT47_010675 [Mucor saturninus]